MMAGVIAAIVVPLKASAAPASVSATQPNTPMTTNTTVVSVFGGTPGYTYAWTVLSNPGGLNVSIGTPAGDTTNFTCNSGLGSLESETVTFRCTVEDVNGVQTTVDVDATFTRTT